MEKVITTRVNAELDRQLKDLARREDRSVSYMMRRAAEELVRKQKKRAAR